MSKDIAKWIKQGTETDGLKKRAEDVASILADTASTADVSSYFANLVSLVNTTTQTQTQTLQERSNIVCHPAHQAPKQACRQLLQAIANDHTIKDMRHQAVGYNGCYVSYSPAAPVFLDQLHDPAQQCIDTCSGDYVSCRNIGLTMVRDWTITECLSNRPDGCR
ncbi:hypothetical protein SJAG_02153 [Schizosaccharomyces japonicus yFS275]|uniref:WD-like domain-containing protein n=1 Tax=Schizosaccharomyces japonicus (strain yFS275 / FY16936) TaxID=402676 RepID=B6K1P2_SCHJY|nr:hypothetical protein SJAG_02153 [Schizosaccharomyces japonicus yFS275]EEB07073.1 hypothetical protein SJAG_02153 [Schizosaccharomyces japonicus yFS275]